MNRIPAGHSSLGGEVRPLIEVRKVVVRPDRLDVLVRVADASVRHVTPSLLAACLRQFPELPQHACKNDVGPVFGSVIDKASTPHLLEHLVITLQVRHDAAEGLSSFSYQGTTQWRTPGSLEARVQLRFRNDVVALDSLNRAVAFLNQTCGA